MRRPSRYVFLILLEDERGTLISAELVLVSTILVLGAVVGLSSVAIGVTAELHDFGQAIGALNQSYQAGGAKTHDSHTSSGLTRFEDGPDQCDVPACQPCFTVCDDSTSQGERDRTENVLPVKVEEPYLDVRFY